MQGRTGIMLTSYLMHDLLFKAPDEALLFFGEARTHTAMVNKLNASTKSHYNVIMMLHDLF